MKKISMTWQIVIASVLGLVCGAVLGPKMDYVRFLGDIFLRLMQMPVILLIMGAIIESVGSLEAKDLGKIGVKTLLLFLMTTVVSASVGLLAVNVIQPGVGMSGVSGAVYDGALFQGTAADLIVEFFSKNIFTAMSEGNMLQTITFSILFGLVLSLMGKHPAAKSVFTFICDLNVVIMELVKLVMKLAPIGVFALLGSITGSMGLAIVGPLLKFLLCIMLGTVVVLGIHLFAVCSYGRLNVFRLLRKMNRSIVVALTTTSSAICLPFNMEVSEQRLGISKRISRLVNPLGMSLNSDGLALTISVACIMVAQFYGIEVTLQQQILIVTIATVTTLGNLLVPGGALVAIAVALQMTGLPLEGVAILAGVDWFAGIFRTLLNAVDDMMVALFIAINEKELDRTIFDAD